MKTEEEKPKIGIDIDDVIFPFMINFLNFINKKNNTSFSFQEITDYHLWEMEKGISREDNVRDALEFQNSPYFDEIDLIEETKEILEEISHRYLIHFITSRPEEIKNKTNALLKRNFPNKEFNVLYSGEVYGGNLSKSEICKSHGISIIIEDNSDYAIDCAKKGIKVFLLDKPWNKDYEEHENITKVENWNEVLEELK